MSFVSSAILPIILFCFACIFLFGKKELYSVFLSGAKEGIKSCWELIPAMVLIMCAVSALFSSGCIDFICSYFGAFLKKTGIPEEMLPAIALRPFSGSGTTAVADKIFSEYGPDSRVSKLTGVFMGSTDTIIYTLGIYFSSVKKERTQYALTASLIVFLISIFTCLIIEEIML